MFSRVSTPALRELSVATECLLEALATGAQSAAPRAQMHSKRIEADLNTQGLSASEGSSCITQNVRDPPFRGCLAGGRRDRVNGRRALQSSRPVAASSTRSERPAR